MIIEFIIIAGLIGGIIYAGMNWPEIEARLFPHQVRRHDATAVPKHPAADDHHAPPPAPATETTIAKGFMKKKEITAEPQVESEDFHKTQGVAEQTPDVAEQTPDVAEQTPDVAEQTPDVATAAPTTAEPEPTQPNQSAPRPDSADAEKSEPNLAADYAASPTPPAAAQPPDNTSDPAPAPPATPGGHVTGAPARPSQPAYVNASAGVEERVEDLAAAADAAYRDRDYEKAEQACLKILMREPKNHKYMTRIGQIYQEMGQLADAKEAFETAKKLDPKNFFVLNRLAEVERLLNDRGGRTSENKRSSKDEE